MNPLEFFFNTNNLNPDQILLSLFWIVLVSICLFFIFREVFTWYWKINKAIGLLEKIEENTRPKPITKPTPTLTTTTHEIKDDVK